MKTGFVLLFNKLNDEELIFKYKSTSPRKIGSYQYIALQILCHERGLIDFSIPERKTQKRKIMKEYINIVSIYCDGNIVVHPFHKYSDAEDKLIACIKETHNILAEQVDEAVSCGYFYDKYDEAFMTIDTKEVN